MTEQIFFQRWGDGADKIARGELEWPSKNFSIRELAQRKRFDDDDYAAWDAGETPVLVVFDFLERMQRLREYLNRPLKITSWYRTPEYNNEISKTGFHGVHTTGCAADIAIENDDEAAEIESAAWKLGFVGIGQHKNFTHVDRPPETSSIKRPARWTY